MPTLTAMAPSWIDQPASPASDPARRLITPVARAFLRTVDFDLDDHPDAPQIVRLADARRITERDTTPAAASAMEPTTRAAPAGAQIDRVVAPAASAPIESGTWAAVEVLDHCDGDSALRLAQVIVAAVATLPRRSCREARVLVHQVGVDGLGHDVVLEDAGSLSTSGVQRHLGSAAAATTTSAHEADLYVADGTGAGVTRLLIGSEGRVTIGIGAPTRRVTPRLNSEGQETIAIGSVVEISVHGGGLLSPADTAAVAASVASALGSQASA